MINDRQAAVVNNDRQAAVVYTGQGSLVYPGPGSTPLYTTSRVHHLPVHHLTTMPTLLGTVLAS